MAVQSFQQAHEQLYGGQTNQPSLVTPSNTSIVSFQQAHTQLINANQAKPTPSIAKVTPPKLSTPPPPTLASADVANNPVMQALAKLQQVVEKPIPTVHFADNAKLFTPLGFVKNVVQGLINMPEEVRAGAVDLGKGINQGNLTAQRTVADIAAAAQLPLMLLTGGGSSVVKEGVVTAAKGVLEQGAKGVVKSVAKNAAIGGGFGALGGLQSGKNITNASDYVKNLLENVGIGAATGGGAAAVGEVALPLAKGLSSKLGAIFVHNADSKPTINHVQLAPEVAQASVLHDDALGKSSGGKAILKTSFDVQKTDQQVGIQVNPEGKYTLPNGSKIDVGAVDTYVPEAPKQTTSLPFTPNKSLTPEESGIETNFSEYLKGNYQEAVQKYNALPDTQGGKVLSGDIAKELDQNYVQDRTKAAAVHEPASAFVKQLYKEKLAQPVTDGKDTVLFTAGGSGAGKTTSLANLPALKQMSEDAGIIVDTNSAKELSSIQKVQQAVDSGRKVFMIYTHRHPLEALANGVLPRAMRTGRTVPLETHMETHMGSLSSIVKIADHFKDNPDVKIRVVDNSLGAEKARIIPLDNLRSLSYNKEELQKELVNKLNEHYETGKISESVYNATKLRESTVRGKSEPNGAGASTKSESASSKPSKSQSGEPTNQQPVGQGKLRDSAAFKRLVDHLETKSPEDLKNLDSTELKYHQTSIADQAEKALQFLQKDPQKAYNVAKGYENPPEGVVQHAITQAVADKAFQEKNYAVWSDVMKTGSLNLTRKGQEIVMERGRYSDTSPQSFVKQVLSQRLATIGKSRLFDSITTDSKKIADQLQSAKGRAIAKIDKVTENLQREIRKRQVKIQSAQNILDALTCK